MKPDTISWKEYTAGKNLPKLLTINDILKRQVNMEAEVLVRLPEIQTPLYEHRDIPTKFWAGVSNFIFSLRP